MLLPRLPHDDSIFSVANRDGYFLLFSGMCFHTVSDCFYRKFRTQIGKGIFRYQANKPRKMLPFPFVVLIPDFPHNIRIRLAHLEKKCCVLTLFCLCLFGCLSLAVRKQQKQNQLNQSYSYIMRKIWYPSNLNSKLLRFHFAQLNICMYSF